MSDTILKGAALRSSRWRSGGPPWFRRLRLKRLGDTLVDYVTEVFAEMERGRHLHPVISAYRPRRGGR